VRSVQVILFTIWAVLLPFWLVISPFLGMAFDAPPTLAIYLGVFSVWSFPIPVIVAWLLKERAPATVFLPLLNLLVLGVLFFLGK